MFQFKKITVLCMFLALMLKPVLADEGMWLLMYLNKNYDEMQARGLKLTPDDIYSVNHASLKDAVVWLGGCSAEIVSPEGLMLTNHHCAYGAIQSHSSVEHDYLKDGFWAKNRKGELPAEGMTASILIRMDDVTQRVLSVTNDDMDVMEKTAAIQEEIKKIVAEAEEGTFYNARVRGMFANNQYFLFVFETFRDLRLVGAPPSSIGKFGGDTDNWEWPRHTGDFSVLRIYMSPDGEPADYSEENIPYQPRHFFPVNIKGVKEGDFSMVIGFPGRTQRYLTSYGIELEQNSSNPARIEIRTRILDIMKEDMNQSEEIRIKYASKFSRLANYWKYFIGQNEGLERLKTVEKKRKMEQEFQHWADSNPARKKKYGDILPQIKENYELLAKSNLFVQVINEAGFAPEIIRHAWRFRGLNTLLQEDNPNQEKINKTIDGIRSSLPGMFKDYNRPTDLKIFAASIELFNELCPAEQLPELIKEANSKYKGDWMKYAGKVFDKSIFDDEATIKAFLDKPSLKALDKDPVFKLVMNMFETYTDNIAGDRRIATSNISALSGKLIQGLMEKFPGKLFYPDANSTIRLTYGNVQSYEPRDAVQYKYYTTIDGVMEKENPDSDEFVVSPKLKALYEKRDFGPYGTGGTLHTDFITNNDITGGNSGSPVIDANGNLIGIAFDGNWEAMTGDLVFDKEYKRCINVDIRYVLFVIDKYAGATNLIQEMKIIQ
jgi:peptidase S46-like protein